MTGFCERPAIVAVGYNRPESMKRLLRSIGEAHYEWDDIPLIISIDKSDVREVQEIAEAFEWKYGAKRVSLHRERLGLRNHILECGDYAIQYGAVIILEDDLAVAPDFYNYTLQALEHYSDDNKIAGISLYGHEWNGYARKEFHPVKGNGDVYFGQFSVTWGQCWSKEQWRAFKNWYTAHPVLEHQDNMPDMIWRWPETSWGKYFVYYLLETQRYYVMPYNSLSTCFSDAGVHTDMISCEHQTRLTLATGKQYEFPLFQDGVHYDIYFENQDLPALIALQNDIADDICIDLYGLKQDTKQCRYHLTTKALPYVSVRSYGLLMRPAEMNILFQVSGNEISLYDTEQEKQKSRSRHYAVLNYNVHGLPWQDALSYGFRRGLAGALTVLKKKIMR